MIANKSDCSHQERNNRSLERREQSLFIGRANALSFCCQLRQAVFIAKRQMIYATCLVVAEYLVLLEIIARFSSSLVLLFDSIIARFSIAPRARTPCVCVFTPCKNAEQATRSA